MYKYWTLDGFGKVYWETLGCLDVYSVFFLDIGWYQHFDVDTHHWYLIIYPLDPLDGMNAELLSVDFL